MRTFKKFLRETLHIGYWQWNDQTQDCDFLWEFTFEEYLIQLHFLSPVLMFLALIFLFIAQGIKGNI